MASLAAAEALARSTPPALPLLRRAMAAWGLAGRVLALETLKRALVLINRCGQLPLSSYSFLSLKMSSRPAEEEIPEKPHARPRPKWQENSVQHSPIACDDSSYRVAVPA